MMLRALYSGVPGLFKTIPPPEYVGTSTVFAQIVRWKRKPIWLPPAKSKLFRVNPRRRCPQEEVEEMKRLFNHYRTYRKTIRRHLIQVCAANQVQYDEEAVRLMEEEDYETCMKLNDEWNAMVAISREARVKQVWEERKTKIEQNIAAKKERDMKIMESIESQVRQAKIDSKTFITRDNIDQAIEEAMANVVQYNVAIDLQGNKYDGTSITQGLLRQ